MKNYLFLYKYGHHYFMQGTTGLDLRYLVDFFAGDYREYDHNVFVSAVNCYDASFVFNDLNHKMLHIGCSEWEIFEEITMPKDEDFPMYVNDTNSCKISHDNFIKLAAQLTTMKNNAIPFALIYRDDQDWVDCKGFETQEAMELFVKTN